MAADVPPETLRITRTLDAPREKVFRAWTRPEALTRWFAPTAKHVTRVPQLEVRVGGSYSIEMELDGRIYRVTGTFREIRFPDRLVFTWRWEIEPDHGDVGETQVTIDLHERGNGTELVLTHEGFPGPGPREQHEQGWAGCLTGLDAFLETSSDALEESR
ncbi:MAG: SRPBCC domain-containing protein [Acidobacteriota bacterium]